MGILGGHRSGVFVALAAAACVSFAQDRTLQVSRPSGAQPAQGPLRVALVIGNAAYRESPLRNPVNDARAMAASLRKLGFEVIARENQGREQMHTAVREFGQRLQRAQVGLFYFAGHGMQVKGRNYLIPVDASIAHEDEVPYRALDANEVLDKMETARTKTNLIILDACRNNPFHSRFRSRRSGLAEMDAPNGTLIAFATAPGSVANDGDGDNGVYTKHLLRYIDEPLPIEQMFKRVRVGVSLETQDAQVPWESSSLRDDFFFQAQQGSPEPPRLQEVNETVLELAFWDAVKASTRAADYAAYLEQYPRGRFAALARVRMQAFGEPSPVAAQPLPPTPSLPPKPSAVMHSPARVGELMTVGFSSDGRWLATASASGEVRILGAANGFVLKRIAVNFRPTALALSLDGARLAVGSDDGQLALLDISSGKVIRRSRPHAGPVQAAAFSPDGRYLLSAGRDGEVRLGTTRTGDLVSAHRISAPPLRALDYAPDGRYFYVLEGHAPATRVRVVEVGSGKDVLSIPATTASFSVNGHYVLLVQDRSPVLRELRTGTELRRFPAQQEEILKGAYAENGEHVSTLDAAGTAVLWETRSGSRVAELRTGALTPRAVAFSPDGRALAIVDAHGNLGVHRFGESAQ